MPTSGSRHHRGQQVLQRSACSPASTTSPTSPWTPAVRPSAATPTRTWTRCSRPELRGWTATRSAAGTNGYGWLGGEKVYNPFDILLLFRSRKFAAHWFETGTPTFLIDTLVKRGWAPLHWKGGRHRRPALHLRRDDMATEALLFQTGYLTIRGPQAPRRPDGVPARLSEPGSAPEPQRQPVAPSGRGFRRARWPTASGSTNCSKPTTSRA